MMRMSVDFPAPLSQQTVVQLRLGPVPKVPHIRVTITLFAELKTELDRYAAMHGHATGATHGIGELIPYMLQAFVNSDRAFAAARRGSKPSDQNA